MTDKTTRFVLAIASLICFPAMLPWIVRCGQVLCDYASGSPLAFATGDDVLCSAFFSSGLLYHLTCCACDTLWVPDGD